MAVVHDAARPFVTAELVRALRGGARRRGAGRAPSRPRPVTDTVKEAGPDGRVTRTLDRSALWAVQTPQVFRAEVLRRGARRRRRRRSPPATDDAALVEAAGGAVAVVEAPPENFKITTAADLRVAEALLAARA